MKTLSILFALALILLTNPARVLSDTTFVSGQIVSQNWNAAGSPYVITGNIQIAGLSIDPGVNILVAGNFEIEVQGVIEAIGTHLSPILFSAKAGVSSWKGIRFQNSYPGSFLKHCIIEKANSSGIRIINSAPVINSCTIRSNQAISSVYGGGVYISTSFADTIRIVDCLIENNFATAYGGGIYISSAPGSVNIERCQLINNEAFSSSGGNAFAYGGAIFANGNSSIKNCRIMNNTTDAREGGIGVTAYSFGAGIYVGAGTTNVYNSILSNNTATASGSTDRRGAGIMSNGGITNIVNSTIVNNNIDGLHRSNGNVTVKNSIIYFNNSNGTQAIGTHTITYSDVQGGYSGVGNIDFNPSLDSNLKITLTSLCRNAGNDSIVYNDACFPPSFSGVRNDMGAHGGPGACAWNDMNIKVRLTALMEGMYNPATNLMSRHQVQRLILRSASSPYTFIDAAAETIATNGISGEFIFNASPTGTYYLVAKNFNNVETWSKSGGENLVRNNSVYNYNFTSSIAQAYGSNLIQKGTKYCIYSADVNQDGYVDGTDLVQVDNDASYGVTSYSSSDINGDYFVDGSDMLIVDNNSIRFVGIIRP